MSKLMVVLTGPTGIGKTKVCIELAERYRSEIISADSRQIFREIPIGTAAPGKEEQALVPHHLIGFKSIFDYYNAFEFEQDALKIVMELFKKHHVLFMVGGSMMYIDAFCNGIDELPTVDPELRQELQEKLNTEGIESIRQQLKILDPDFYQQVDLKNPKRVVHAVEICLMTGKPYSSLRTAPKKKRPFSILKIGLNMERAELYNRINSRVLQMVDEGLLKEVEALIEHQHLNALNTVGYKELFASFNGEYSTEKAIELIQRNSRHYAKKQLSWFRRDAEMQWFHPGEINEIARLIDKNLSL
ncbi:tRNA (adenosine(37)-N6)-dimethylallyltransferase MiaA [Alkalitalea saponilacus]|uniref:tRNA dimethylallyltransferase n=1 Tax=Alkalitalea saponilacus TaxID=889453 RepID=A0A1T5GSG7_9BACT|nr:tRNA (adenosine(37)-N6)-dimethylallyltransferase MiaA [Alkalitalea saponilacus]ASB48206.1 tRNA (adenosine(37)-N6)-dimethylallyltransferase MiaA [Alkalitalea saponilacus]SKC11344.1 tRNA dimethylallyltransferase [Alkalitalea saponilacus]